MVSLTENEARVVSFLLKNFSRDYNINRVATKLKLSPRGAYKILKKLEKEGFLLSKKVGNNLIYKINFSYDSVSELCQFVISDKTTSSYIKVWINDLQPLKKFTEMAVLFGSILVKEKEAGDVDILLVFKKKNLLKVQEQIKMINQIKTKKIHAIIQTREDLIKNIRLRDTAILEEIGTGLILWGRDILVEAIKNGQN